MIRLVEFSFSTLNITPWPFDLNLKISMTNALLFITNMGYLFCQPLALSYGI